MSNPGYTSPSNSIQKLKSSTALLIDAWQASKNKINAITLDNDKELLHVLHQADEACLALTNFINTYQPGVDEAIDLKEVQAGIDYIQQCIEGIDLDHQCFSLANESKSFEVKLNQSSLARNNSDESFFLDSLQFCAKQLLDTWKNSKRKIITHSKNREDNPEVIRLIYQIDKAFTLLESHVDTYLKENIMLNNNELEACRNFLLTSIKVLNLLCDVSNQSENKFNKAIQDLKFQLKENFDIGIDQSEDSEEELAEPYLRQNRF